MPARSEASPAEAMEASSANATMPTTKPIAIAALAYHVAGWIGESRNARIGLRARVRG